MVVRGKIDVENEGKNDDETKGENKSLPEGWQPISHQFLVSAVIGKNYQSPPSPLEANLYYQPQI